MQWLPLLLIAIAGLCWWLLRRGPRNPGEALPDLEPRRELVVGAHVDRGAEAVGPAQAEQRRLAIRQAAVEHGPALVCLLCVARADGRASPGEVTEMVDFLRRRGVASVAAAAVARVRDRFTGTAAEFEAGLAQIQDDTEYRQATLRAMELIVERGKLAHPAELEMVSRAAQVWGLDEPKFFLPVGRPLR